MGCPSFAILGNNLTFSIASHDPDTGVLTDADALPTYEVFEEDGDTVLLSGSMTKRDAANDGRYTKTIAITTANSFANNKCYTIEILATVDGDTGGKTYTFTAYSQLGNATGGSVEWDYVVTDEDTGDPIDGVEVKVTTDSAGSNVIATGTTDDYGSVTFYIDPGTVYIWCSRSGYNFSNPDQETISA